MEPENDRTKRLTKTWLLPRLVGTRTVFGLVKRNANNIALIGVRAGDSDR